MNVFCQVYEFTKTIQTFKLTDQFYIHTPKSKRFGLKHLALDRHTGKNLDVERHGTFGQEIGRFFLLSVHEGCPGMFQNANVAFVHAQLRGRR